MSKKLTLFVTVFMCVLISSRVQAADAITLAATLSDRDFMEKGFAQVELQASFVLEGKPISAVPVVWEAASVENHSQAVPVSEKDRTTGLRWGHPLPSDQIVEAYHTVTDSGGISRAVLTDIIGERSVTVTVTFRLGAEVYTAKETIVFGNGPLSIFSAPIAEPVTWNELYEICNGEPYPGDPGAWVVGTGYVGGNKMPSLEQMQSISMPSAYNHHPGAMAAAVAAGWPVDKRYWNGRVVMKGRASHIDIRKGTHHGSGGNEVSAKEYGVCLR